MRKMIDNELYNSIQNLERFTIVEVLAQIVSRVADIVATTATMAVKVEWIFKILDEIATKREHLIFFKKP